MESTLSCETCLAPRKRQSKDGRAFSVRIAAQKKIVSSRLRDRGLDPLAIFRQLFRLRSTARNRIYRRSKMKQLQPEAITSLPSASPPYIGTNDKSYRPGGQNRPTVSDLR